MRTVYFSVVFIVLSVGEATAEKQNTDSFLTLEQGDGLVVTIPVSGVKELLKHLNTYHSNLNKQRSDYTTQVENTKFTVKDALIAAILPGGLIYAANKKQRYNRAEANLLNISNQLDELTLDMNYLALKSTTQSVALLK